MLFVDLIFCLSIYIEDLVRAKIRSDMLRRYLSFSLIMFLAGCNTSQNNKALFWDDADSLVAQIQGNNIREHMIILADDDMQGREAGTENYDKAADYVINNFKELGIKPLPNNNESYLQPIKFTETRLDLTSPKMSITNGTESIDFAFRDEFIRSGGYGEINEEISAPLVFAGYGIISPEYERDDFSDIEVRDKILVLLSGAPPYFKSAERAYYSSGRVKAETAISKGAVGIVFIRTPVDQKRRAWEKYLPGLGAPGMRWLDNDGKPYQGFQELKGTATMSDTGAKKMFEFSGHDLDGIFAHHEDGGTGSFDMNISAQMSRKSIRREVYSSNVLGFIEGSDEKLKQEYLVYSSHLDHLGVRGDGEDNIYNGAYDNAAGIGAIIEIAKAISTMEVKPKRSIIFAAVTAEEKGLQGSSYFAKNPLVMKKSLIANINIDMPYLGFPVADLHAFGSEHSSLYSAVESATSYLGIQFTPDPLPEEVRFVRSDQFSFVKEGIPAIGLRPGTVSFDPDIDGAKELDNYLKNYYHQPNDDLSLPFSSRGAEGFVRSALLTGLIISDDENRPSWNNNDFFGEKFSPK